MPIIGGIFNWQTKHLLAETAAPDSCSAKANKTFMLKRDLLMSPRGAQNAELQGRISSAAAEADMAIRNVRCSPQYARNAEEIRWFLSGHPTTSRFIARTASSHRNGQETGINEQTPLPCGGGVLYYRYRLVRYGYVRGPGTQYHS